MLEKIKIKNFVLIEDAELNFSNNLNILIGETGGGKSLVFRAISQLFGNRGQKKYIKEGQTSYEISAVFSNNQEIVKKLERDEIEVMDKLYITRKFNHKSQNRITVNGEIVSLSRLEELMRNLAEITMQNEYRKITIEDYLRLFNPEKKIVQSYKEILHEYKELELQKNKLEKLNDNVEEETLIVKHRLNELKIVNEIIDPEELQLKIINITKQIENYSIYQSTNEIVTRMHSMVEINRDLPEVIAERLYGIKEELANLSFDLSNQLETQISETEFNEMQNQFSDYKRIERKYGKSYNELKFYFQELEARYEKISSLDMDISIVDNKLQKMKSELEIAADKYSAELKMKAKKAEQEIQNMLKAVGLEQAKVKFNFKELTTYRITGKEEIKLLIDVNNQHNYGDINTTLSGGEFARLLLILKVINPVNDNRVLLLFDEIDTGISGEVAQKIAKLIKSLSEKNQIILITHLAQTAASSKKLFKISKTDGISKVQELKASEHYLEIAKLLSGSEVTNEAKIQAKKLIKEVE